MKKFADLLFAGILPLCLGMNMNSGYAATGYGSTAPYDRFEEGEDFIDGYGEPDFEGAPYCCSPPCDGSFNEGCCSHFAFGIDYLYWDVSQTGLDYAKSTLGTEPSSNTCCECETPCRSETDFFKFKPRSGFRVGVSYPLPCWDDVSLNFIYTYFHPRVKRSFHIPHPSSNQVATLQMTTDVINIGAFPLEGCNREILPDGDFKFDQPDSVVRSRMRLKYELFDLVLSKNFGCGCWSLLPYIGGRVLWIRESFHNSISGTWFKPGPPPLPPMPLRNAAPEATFVDGLAELQPPIGTFISSAYRFAWKQKIPAAGLTLGVHARYSLCCEWSVFGHFGLSVLGGHVKYHDNYYPDISLGCPTVKYRANHWNILTGWDGSLGLSYDWNFCVCPIRIEVGYEIQDWFNVLERVRYFNKNEPNTPTNPISTAQTSDSHGRLTLHGLIVRFAFTF